MKLKFVGDVNGLEAGIEILSDVVHFTVSDDGIPVKLEKRPGNIEVIYINGEGNIKCGEKIHFFRAIGLLLENLQDSSSFKIEEEPQFTTNGVMIDVSRNSVMRVDTVKEILRRMALMGLNILMLYTEDTYEVKSRPYFGYMRGRYSTDELKEIDDYADIFGIEVIPCIQTLAHFTEALKWQCMDELRDTEAVLLAGEDKTYEFIEELIKSASAPFRSNRIHIGMDEAHGMGLGRYLEKHGYRRRFDIMNEHLARVIEITNKYNLKPMIWSDMYFRLASKTNDYYQWEDEIPEDVIKNVPDEVQLVYWDYYHDDEEPYNEMIKCHKRFNKDILFAGGVWTWAGIMVNYGKTFKTTNSALKVCKQQGVKEVFATMWGDDGAETNFFTGLLGLQLYAEHGYSRELDMNKLKKRLKFCTGGDYDAFMSLDLLDHTPGTCEYGASNPSKYLLWQDILIGLFDKVVESMNMTDHYLKAEKILKKYAEDSNQWSLVFETAYKICSVLIIKSEIGLRLKESYDKKDNEGLRHILEKELPELLKRVKDLKETHRKQWLKSYKAFGWEVIDIRYGGVISRTETAIARIEEYLNGGIDRIEELDEERLLFNCEVLPPEKKVISYNRYFRIATACPMG